MEVRWLERGRSIFVFVWCDVGYVLGLVGGWVGHGGVGWKCVRVLEGWIELMEENVRGVLGC